MRWIQGMAVGALSLALAACSSSPTGRQQLTLVSDQQLNQMGAQTFEQYQQKLPTVGGATLNYVQCVSNAIVAELPSSDLAPQWQVKVFDDPSANAFALPGGYIGVNTGLLEIASDQDQLAAVIGHEIAHVLARHANERVSTQQATQLGLSVIQSAAGLEGPQGEAMMGGTRRRGSVRHHAALLAQSRKRGRYAGHSADGRCRLRPSCQRDPVGEDEPGRRQPATGLDVHAPQQQPAHRAASNPA